MSHHHKVEAAAETPSGRHHHRSEREHGTSHTASRHRPREERVKAEQAITSGQAADYLEALAEALRAGGVTLRAGDRALGMRLGAGVSMKLRAGNRPGHGTRISLRLAWGASKGGRPSTPIDIRPMALAEPAGGGGMTPEASTRDLGGDADVGDGADTDVGAPTEGGVPEERAGAPRMLDGEP